jgi:hypothetical protein
VEENVEKRWGFMSVPQIALAAAQHLKTDRPAEFGFAQDADIVIEELHEGSESRKFFQGVFHFENLIKTDIPIKL